MSKYLLTYLGVLLDQLDIKRYGRCPKVLTNLRVVIVVICLAFGSDVTQGRINGSPNETKLRVVNT